MDARGPYGPPASLESGQDVLRKRGASRLPSEGPLHERPLHERPQERDRSRPVRVARGISAVLLVICLVGALQAVFMIVVEARRWTVAEREIVRLEREVADLRREAADLIEVAMRGGDERFREHLARRQGYVFPDETRYLLSTPMGP